MAQLARRNHRIELLRLLQHLNGKAMRQVKFANDDFDIDTEVVFDSRESRSRARADCRLATATP